MKTQQRLRDPWATCSHIIPMPEEKCESAHTDREWMGGDEVSVREIGNNCGADSDFLRGDRKKHPES